MSQMIYGPAPKPIHSRGHIKSETHILPMAINPKRPEMEVFQHARLATSPWQIASPVVGILTFPFEYSIFCRRFC